MRLGLHDRHKPFMDGRGVVRMYGHDLRVVDLDSGAEVENLTAMLWCAADLLTAPIGDGEGLLTPEHVTPGKSYLVVVVECEAAEREPT